MSRYLVVANQTIGGSELMDEIRRRIAAGTSSFYVLVPATTAVGTAYAKVMAAGDTGLTPSAAAGFAENDEAMAHRAETISRSRLSQLINQIRGQGAEAEGDIGPADPLKAIAEVIASGGFDEIIISTLPVGVSRWLRLDVPNRAKRKFKIPVTTVTAKK